MATGMKARSVPSDITLDVLFARGARLRLELDLARREVALLRALYAANYRGILKGNTEGTPPASRLNENIEGTAP
jgi:hypothetical protein